MRKVVLTYGIIAGIIVVAIMVIAGIGNHSNGDFAMSAVLGYAGMIVSLSMIFFGIRRYRDQYSGGEVTFGRAFLIGLYISIIASVFYVIGWKIYSQVAIPDFADRYAKYMVDNLKKSGVSDSVVAAKTKEMADWKEMYKNPVFELGMTFLEIFPVGLLISLICAGILKRKKKVQVVNG